MSQSHLFAVLKATGVLGWIRSSVAGRVRGGDSAPSHMTSPQTLHPALGSSEQGKMMGQGLEESEKND